MQARAVVVGQRDIVGRRHMERDRAQDDHAGQREGDAGRDQKVGAAKPRDRHGDDERAGDDRGGQARGQGQCAGALAAARQLQ